MDHVAQRRRRRHGLRPCPKSPNGAIQGSPAPPPATWSASVAQKPQQGDTGQPSAAAGDLVRVRASKAPTGRYRAAQRHRRRHGPRPRASKAPTGRHNPSPGQRPGFVTHPGPKPCRGATTSPASPRWRPHPDSRAALALRATVPFGWPGQLPRPGRLSPPRLGRAVHQGSAGASAPTGRRVMERRFITPTPGFASAVRSISMGRPAVTWILPAFCV